MKCEFSGKTSSVSDGDVRNRTAFCPGCGKRVRITIPDKKMHGNTAKFASHAAVHCYEVVVLEDAGESLFDCVAASPAAASRAARIATLVTSRTCKIKNVHEVVR